MYQRSFSLLSPENSQLLVIDIQERLIPSIKHADRIVFNTRRLLNGATAMGIPIVVSEQYPKGLGPTLPVLDDVLAEGTPRIAKKSFSVCETESLRRAIEANEVPKIILCGVEAHVCVLQTAFDLLALGREVYVVVDAVGSRFKNDSKIALRRLESAGVTLTTTESILFEWIQSAEHPQFKTISNLAKEKMNKIE